MDLDMWNRTATIPSTTYHKYQPESTKMHRAWLVPDLVNYIFDFIEGQEGSIGKDLFSLSLVSTVLHEPALDRIWYHIRDLRPLVDCFPTDLWCRSEEVFLRDILPSDWKSFRKHAHRIRSFADSKRSQHRNDVPPSIYRAIYQATNGECIIPNVQKVLLLCDALPGRIFFGEMLLGPHVSEFGIILPHSERRSNEISCIMRCYFSLLTSALQKGALRKLAVPPLQKEAPMTHLSTLLCQWHSNLHALIRLVAGTLTPDAWLNIAQLPNLQRLAIVCSSGSVTSTPTPMIDIFKAGNVSKPFPSLRHLRIDVCGSFTICKGFIDSISSPHVKSLNFDVHWTPASQDISLRDFFAAISSRWCGTLNTLTISCGRNLYMGGVEDCQNLSRHQIEPLLAIQTLVHIGFTSFRGACTISLDDDTMKDMAYAWPKLRLLKFKSCLPENNKVTLKGLGHFRDHCPELEHIALTFEVRDAIVALDHDQAHTSLEVLEVVDCIIAAPASVEEIADFLKISFPSLKKLVVSGLVPPLCRGWNDVAKILGVEFVFAY